MGPFQIKRLHYEYIYTGILTPEIVLTEISQGLLIRNDQYTLYNNINISSATDSFNYHMEVDSNDIYVADTSSGTLVSTTFLEQKESVLKLWPNPVRGQLNILSEEYIREIRLYDQLMREISTEGYATGSNQYVLDLSGLKRGIYLLRINGMNVKARVLKL